jgi:hypothetical protein
MRNLVLSLLLAAGSSQAGFISSLYNNTTTDTGFTDGFAVNNLVEAGDQITMDSSLGGWAVGARTALYNSAAVSGLADVTLRIYSVSDNVLGPQLLLSTLTDVNFAADSTTYINFGNLNTEVPGTLVWTLSWATSAAIAPEFLDYDPPTLGTSDNRTVWWDTGSGLTLTTPGYNTENYYFRLDGTAAPEPGSLMLMGAGVLVILKRHRHKGPFAIRAGENRNR